MSDDIAKKIAKPQREEDPQGMLFDTEPDWRAHWWDMPEFDPHDIRPQYKLTVNFLTAKDRADFARATGIKLTESSDTAWFPDRRPITPGKYYYDGDNVPNRYPICIPSKGRAEHQNTGNLLEEMDIPHNFFVEETEYDHYCQKLGAQRVIKMPFHDLGQGSIPARNFIWEWAKQNGHARHWVVDDNMRSFARGNNAHRLNVKSSGFFASMEDFADRYKNVALAGPHDKAFSTIGWNATEKPYLLNTRIYSCILIDTSFPHRWRGKYNEDTDLSLRVLKDGYCTILFRALLMDKPGTSHSSSKATPGGNTDHVYKDTNHRREFAESLQQQHPDVVKVVWKFGRWHHEVDYSPFKGNRLEYRDGVIPIPRVNNYGMKLKERDDE